MTILSFRNNPNLKEAGSKMEFTPEMLQEIKKCSQDPVYFIENYFYIKTIDQGKVLFKMWDFQKDYIRAMHENRFMCALMARQMGKSACTSAYICWFIIFNDAKDVGIVANKLRSAKRVLRAVKLGYEMIPKWLQQGVVEWNKESITLENDSMVMAASTSAEAVTGDSLAMLYVDEVSKIDANLWDEFYTAAYPVISSGHTSKVLMTSSAKGMNHWYYLYENARKGISEYKAFEAKWNMRPDRDERWKQTTIANTSQEQFDQEFENIFAGSSKTLIKPAALQLLLATTPLKQSDSSKIFKDPEPNRQYIISVDTSRGLSLDKSVLTVIDISTEVHEEVAFYASDTIDPIIAFPKVIKRFAETYNDALVLIELNDLGEACASHLYNTLEYENLVINRKENIDGTKGKARLGIVMNKFTRPKGCTNTKRMIEGGRFKPNSSDLIAELNVFVDTGTKYEAEAGFHDDHVMTIVNYAYYISTPEFMLNHSYNLHLALQGATDEMIEDDLAGLGMKIDDGLPDDSINRMGGGMESYSPNDKEWEGF